MRFRLLQLLGILGLSFPLTSCMLLLEGASATYKESKVIPRGSAVEGNAFTVRSPENGLYVKKRDRANDAVVLGDSAGGFETFVYAVFPIEASPGESPSAALLRHYAKHTPRASWRVVATRRGEAKGSAGQVDLHLAQGPGFVTTGEFFSDGSRYWVTARMQRTFGTDAKAMSRGLKSTRSALKDFAASFRLKSGT